MRIAIVELSISLTILGISMLVFFEDFSEYLINLEKSLKVGDELGGHIVTGHIDSTAVVKEIATDKNSHTLKISIPETLHKYITRKGSITLNGTSLTVNEVGNDWFKVNLIPHTNDVTTWKDIETGQLINLEVDILARYVAQILISR